VAEQPTLIRSVQRALHLLEVVGERDRPISAKALARVVDLPLPTAYHLLRTLVHEGFLDKVPDGYILGGQAVSLSGGLGAERFRPILSSLRDELGAACYLAVFRDGEIELVDVVDSPRHPRTELWVGPHDAAHATAFGKAILAQLSSDDRNDYLTRHPLVDLTPRTVTSRSRLIYHLIDTSGIAVDSGEYHLDVACVGVPVAAVGLPAAVAVSVPAERQRHLAGCGPVLKREARALSLALSRW
jgi:DNA-binding IclR family transcriptional regulator